MNDINELQKIIQSLGGSASLDDIVKEYLRIHHMANFALSLYKSVAKETLDKFPQFVSFIPEQNVYVLEKKEPKTTASGVTGNVQFLRNAVYEWEKDKREAGTISAILGNPSQRHYMITPRMAEIVPYVGSHNGVAKSGYYCVYEIEIRQDKAVVRLMATVTDDTPDSIIKIYKDIILPSIGKEYRYDGKFYNKTFNSMKITSETTDADMIEFMNVAVDRIYEYELELA